MPLPLDPARLRANFPAFAEPSLQGQFFFQNARLTPAGPDRALITALDAEF